jgi:hypothetical protein
MLLMGIVVLIPVVRSVAAAVVIPLGVGSLIGRRPRAEADPAAVHA